MLPDIICIGIILFFVCAMAVSDKDSCRLRFADRLGFLFGIRRKHNETCIELRGRIHAHQLASLKHQSGLETAMQRANDALIKFGMSCKEATINFNSNRNRTKNK